MTTDLVQLTLAPERPLQFTPMTLSLGSIRPPAEGLPPSKEFVKSVRHLGVFQSILVRRVEGCVPPQYTIEAGRKRYQAAAIVKQPTIPAVVVEGLDGWADAEIIAAVENELRTDNLIQTLKMLERLYGQGIPPAEVSASIGISITRQRRVWRLHSLIPDLRLALAAGRLKPSVAEAAARLPELAQRDLAAAESRITKEMVDAHRRADCAAAAEQLLQDLDGVDQLGETSQEALAGEEAMDQIAAIVRRWEASGRTASHNYVRDIGDVIGTAPIPSPAAPGDLPEWADLIDKGDES